MVKCCIIILLILSGKLFAQTPPNNCIPVLTIAEDKNNICPGATVTFQATVANGGTNGVYTWKKNNVVTGATSSAVYTDTNVHDADVVVCEYSCTTACGADTLVVSNAINLHVLNDIEPTISVANTDPLICEGELTVFTATAYYGTWVPFYQWSVNDSLVGSNSPVFTTSTITNGARIKCVLTASAPACPGLTKSTSSQLTIYVYPMIHPAIKITPSKASICRGETVTFTATANGGTFPAFAWKINGISTGANAPTLVSDTLKEGDIISCTVTIDQDSRCHTTTSAPSNEIVMHVRDFTDPIVTIASMPDVCKGKPVTFTATAQNAGDYTIYQWQVNGQNKASYSATYTNDQLANGDTVSCILSTSIPGCALPVSVLSNKKGIRVKSVPEITFAPPEVSVLSGEPAQLQAVVSGHPGSVKWTPAGLVVKPQSLLSSTVPLMENTVFTLDVADTNGCPTSKELVVKVIHRIFMPSSFTPNNDGKNDVYRIPPGASLSLQDFSIFDRWGNIVFKTNNITKGWDGTQKGESLATGVYVYLVKGRVLDKPVMLKGTVVLHR
ncbi:gliding motility-associated C-terminal domain-containing protein [Ferruginibacter paludis]|uniref:gliding motility-associated C-terminal domain-containing protein n=1 Tax=Ferruginibacter paludis TaxID=1310417 RepID=UPI0025B4734E|nr:gliding motility-associated C-terminal domain-containing protein [Ferruginibacter paludis]MDN3655384.1 gliding motility-associated C-terminal domain-containing protein [Ferruginibacter paludis]